MRLDLYLANKYPLFSRSQITKFIKNKLVLVNGKIAKPSSKLKDADKIDFNPPKINKEIKIRPDSELRLEVIFEDKNLLIINKPAGISVHPSVSNSQEKTLINALIARYPEIVKVGEDKLRPGIVHRLDKDTSGVLIIAKNNTTFKKLKNKFANHEIQKTYLALASGEIKDAEGEIDLAIGRSVTNPLKQAVANNAKVRVKKTRPASTKYKVIKRYREYTLLEVYPLTGRTHQIRVHMKAIGHPVAGDLKYGFKKQKMPLGLKRQFLHARIINFNLDNKSFKFEAELPQDLKNFLKHLH